MSVPTRTNSLIIGCGYLGTRLARLLIKNDHRVFGTTRSADRAHELSQIGVVPLIVSVTEASTFDQIHQVFNTASINVYYLIPPGRPSSNPAAYAVIREGIGNTVKSLSRKSVTNAILASSTAVYHSTNNNRVDADSESSSHSERAVRLLGVERRWLQGLSKSKVVRLAGLYGPRPCHRPNPLEV